MSLIKSGPVVCKTGDVVRGLSITGSGGPAVRIPAGVTDVLIEANYITAPGATEFARGIDIYPGASRIVIRGNHIDDVSTGVYAAQALNPITIGHNLFTRPRGPLPRGQGVQFNGVHGDSAQSRIVWNIFDEAVMVEDWINMFASSGSAAYPTLVAYNRIRGGGRRVVDALGNRRWDASGSGICLGDYGGGFFDVLHNLLVWTQNTGIGVAGAKDVRVIGNVVSNAGTDADTQTRSAITVATYANNRPERVTLRGNRCVANNWLIDPADPVYRPGVLAAGFWTDGTALNLTVADNQWQDETLTADIWRQTPVNPTTAALLAAVGVQFAKAHTPDFVLAQTKRAALL